MRFSLYLIARPRRSMKFKLNAARQHELLRIRGVSREAYTARSNSRSKNNRCYLSSRVPNE